MTDIYVVLETGFGQLENIQNGIKELEHKLWTLLPHNQVWRYRHTVDPDLVASRLRSIDPWPIVIVAGHSMGGRGVNNVCKLLEPRPIYAEVLCDAWGNKLGRIDIQVPGNVREVDVFRSKNNVIEGSTVRLVDPSKTLRHDHDLYDVAHPKMSSLEDFHNSVIAYVQSALRG